MTNISSRVGPFALFLALLWLAVTSAGSVVSAEQEALGQKRPLTLENMGGGGGGGGGAGGGVSISPDGSWLAIGGASGLRLERVDGTGEPKPWFQGSIAA
jgi:hypothetical protein